MKRWGTVTLAALVLGVWSGPAAADEVAKVPNGKPIFAKYKCRACHNIEGQGIKKKAEAGEAEESIERKPPDLSGVGVKRKAAWIEAYLLKKEMIEKRKHEKKFRGTAAELKSLAAWLESLKDEKAAVKMEKSEKGTGGE